MTSLSRDFTDKLFADYEANAKYSAIENAVTHNGLLKSIETRQSAVENDLSFLKLILSSGTSMKNQIGSWNKSLLQQIKRLAVVRLNSFWIPLNKMVDNGIWSYHFSKNMVSFLNQYIQSL